MRKRGPSRTHFGLVTPQSYRVVECSLTQLNHLGASYVLVGGWAIATYGSVVPSVDTDTYIHRADRDTVVAGVEKACGFQVNQSDTLELLDWDEATSVLSLDLDTGGVELSFDPRLLFRNHPPIQRTITLPDRPPIHATVPDADTLLFLKLCAFRSRRFYWEANRDPSALARMDVFDRNVSRQKTVLHWERKAGKDLFDAAFLTTVGARPDAAAAISVEFGLRGALREAVTNIPPLLEAYAADLAPDPARAAEVPTGTLRLQEAFR